jgi:hypothetical protein
MLTSRIGAPRIGPHITSRRQQRTATAATVSPGRRVFADHAATARPGRANDQQGPRPDHGGSPAGACLVQRAPTKGVTPALTTRHVPGGTRPPRRSIVRPSRHASRAQRRRFAISLRSTLDPHHAGLTSAPMRRTGTEQSRGGTCTTTRAAPCFSPSFSFGSSQERPQLTEPRSAVPTQVRPRIASRSELPRTPPSLFSGFGVRVPDGAQTPQVSATIDRGQHTEAMVYP